MRCRCILICLLAAVYGGCVSYHDAPIAPERTAAQFAARRLDDPQLRADVGRLLPQSAAAWPPREWDRAALLAVALVQNPDLAAARSQVQTVRAHEISAAQVPNPDLTLESEYALHDTHPWLYGVGLNWLLHTGERRRLDIELARLDTGNARLKLMDDAWAVRRALAAALSEGESAHRRLELLAHLTASQERLIELERRRVSAGEDSPSQLLSHQRALIDIELETAEQRALADTAQAAIAKALGLPPQALDGVALAWPDWGEPAPLQDEQLRAHREQALLSRADLRVAMGEYAVAETKLHQAVARQYPELTLGPGYYWDHGIAKFPFDLGFALPVNRNKGEIAEATAGRDLAGRRMLALQADIYGDIAAAERAERTARSNLDAAERQSKTARRQLAQAELAVRVGASDSLEQIGAELSALRAELELVQMRAQLQNSRNVLEDALRAPLSGPEIALANADHPAWPGADL